MVSYKKIKNLFILKILNWVKVIVIKLKILFCKKILRSKVKRAENVLDKV